MSGGPRRLGAPLTLALTLLVAACSAGTDRDATTTTAEPAPEAPTSTTGPLAQGTLDEIELATLQVAELDQPVALAARPSTGDLYVVERSGRVRLVKVTRSTSGTGSLRYQLQTTPVVDLTKEVLSESKEQGLLGAAFSSDGRKLYLDYTAEPDGRTVVVEYVLGDRATVDLKSRRVLLEVDQPAVNHNGGQLVVGPDGYLYVGLGDGGGRGDPDDRAQDTSDLLGKILRIDPEAATDDAEYGVPAGNPFADGEEGAPEVWLYGVRNPWRFSFDAETGDLWVGDVGQNEWEEIDRLPATGGFDAGRGDNLGWDEMEGSHPFDGGENPIGGVLPVFEYSHDDGCSVVGGYVYRGDAIEALRGAYLFGDYCAAGLRGIQLDGATVIDDRTWDIGGEGLQSLGQDNDGEVFLLLASGEVLKVIPDPKR